MFPDANNSADNDPDVAAKGADGRMYNDIQRQIALYCAPAEAAMMALPPAGISKAWRQADVIFSKRQFPAPGAPSGQRQERTQRIHMHVRGWPNLQTVTAAPATFARSRSKTGVKHSSPKENPTGYVTAIVKQFSPDNIIRHEHPAGSEETGMAATRLRERFGPDAVPPSNTAGQAGEHCAPHKCWRLLPTGQASVSQQGPARGGTLAAKLRKTKGSPPPGDAGDVKPRSLEQRTPEGRGIDAKGANARATSVGRTDTFSKEPPGGDRVAAIQTTTATPPDKPTKAATLTALEGRKHGPQTRDEMYASTAVALKPLEEAAARQAARTKAGEQVEVSDEVNASHNASRGPGLRATMETCAATGSGELNGPATVNMTEKGLRRDWTRHTTSCA